MSPAATQLFDEMLFTEQMIQHYENLYSRFRKQWRFRAAAFAYKKLRFYKKEMIELRCLQNRVVALINDVNSQYHGHIITTS